MKGHTYSEWKNGIKAAIVDQYGSQSNFAALHIEEGYSKPVLSRLLNPSRSCNIRTLEKLCEKLDLEIVVKNKPKKAA